MIFKHILLVICLYAINSFFEYFFHKYCMHTNFLNNKTISSINNKTKNHLLHHLDVKIDMKLDDKYINHLDGLYFNIYDTFNLIILFFIINTIIIKIIFKYKITYKYIILLSIINPISYYFLWNYIHPKMHQISNNKIDDMNFFEKILFKNHSYHHLQKGDKKGNYNIVYLGADYLFNAYNNCVDNKEYCKKNYKKLNKDAQQLCDLEKNNKKLPNGLKFCN